MKKIFTLLIVSVFITSCGVMQLNYKATTYSIDYSMYTKDDFFITESESVGFEYVPVASVGSSIETGYLSSKNGGKNEKIYATAEDALAYLVVQSQRLGANALIGLKIINTSVNQLFPSYSASGMAVKK